MECKHCRTVNASSSRFCLGCSVPLEHEEPPQQVKKKKSGRLFKKRVKLQPIDPLVHIEYTKLPNRKDRDSKTTDTLDLYTLISKLLRIILLVTFIILAIILAKILITAFYTVGELSNLFDLFRGLTS